MLETTWVSEATLLIANVTNSKYGWSVLDPDLASLSAALCV